MTKKTLRNFPIDFVLKHDLPELYKTRKKTITGYTLCDCVFCGNKKNKFDINLNKQNWRCNACGTGGNSLQLHAKLINNTGSAAYRDLWNIYNNLPRTEQVDLDKPVEVKQETKQVPITIRNYIYRAFLDRLTLSEDHKASLMKRGLTEDAINSLMIKDVPTKEMIMTGLVSSLMLSNQEVRNYVAKNNDIKIPGLLDLLSNEPKCVARESGILIPIIVKNPNASRTEDQNLISGFQVRFDSRDVRYKYYVSSEREGGIGFSGCASIHCLLPDSKISDGRVIAPVCKRVILTEGNLKADVASCLSNNTPFIAVLGVNNQKYLPITLKMLKTVYKTEEIIIAFDQDYVDNKNVANALVKVKNLIEEEGLIAKECHWPEEYKNNGIKGIDDLLLFNKMKKMN